jgi:hypothetical protein
LAIAKKENREHFLDVSDITAALSRAGTDPLLDDASRQKIAELWKAHEALRADFDSPIGTLAQYVDRCDKNRIAVEDLVSYLAVSLGMDVNEVRPKTK